MAKKKKLAKAERKEARLRKGKQWLLTYTGSPKKMNKHYRERFHVDAVTAAKDLQELGVNYTQEQLDQIKQAEEQRLQQRRMEREVKERERLAELYEDSDDRFAFIAGYTDGGAPFGVMWEEVGIDPGLPFEEKVKLYHMQPRATELPGYPPNLRSGIYDLQIKPKWSDEGQVYIRQSLPLPLRITSITTTVEIS